jgi:hypothetical protein
MRSLFLLWILFVSLLFACNPHEPGGNIIEYDRQQPIYDTEMPAVDSLLNYQDPSVGYRIPDPKVITHNDSFLVLPYADGTIQFVYLPSLSLLSSGSIDKAIQFYPLFLTHIYHDQAYFVSSDFRSYQIKSYDVHSGQITKETIIPIPLEGRAKAIHCRGQYLYCLEHFELPMDGRVQTTFQIKRIDLTSFEESIIYKDIPRTKYSNTTRYALTSDEQELYFHHLSFDSPEIAQSVVNGYRFADGSTTNYLKSPYDVDAKPEIFMAAQIENFMLAAGKKAIWYSKVDDQTKEYLAEKRIIGLYTQGDNYIVERWGYNYYWRIRSNSGALQSKNFTRRPVYHHDKKIYAEASYNSNSGRWSYCITDEYSGQTLSCTEITDSVFCTHFFHEATNSLVYIGGYNIYRFYWPY